MQLTSQGEAEALRGLNLGTSSAILNNEQGNPLETLLKGLMQGVIDALGKSMDKYDVNASRRLRQSFKVANPIVSGEGVSVGITVGESEYYWKFINKGVNGTEQQNGAPNWGSYTGAKLDYKTSILNWIRDRGITTDGDYDSLAWAIMTKIKQEGKKPRPFFDDVINDPQLIELLKKPIEKLIGRAIEVKIAAPWQ